MRNYGDLSRQTAIDRLSSATEHERFLDGLVWLHAGCDLPPSGPMRPSIWGPFNQVNGRSMQTAYELGLSSVESAFSVPLVTMDLSKAFNLACMWFDDFSLDLKTGAGSGHTRHVAVLRIAGLADLVGRSGLGGAAALCACLLQAVPFSPKRLPGYHFETA